MTWYLPWRTCTYPKAQRAACAHPLVLRGLLLISLILGPIAHVMKGRHSSSLETVGELGYPARGDEFIDELFRCRFF